PAGDHRGLAAIAVGDLRRARQLRLAADLHLADAFRPAGDDAVQRELGGRAALVARVELGAVDERALVVHADRVGGGRGRAGADLLVLDDQARGRLLGA